jgi:hypothetical protein
MANPTTLLQNITSSKISFSSGAKTATFTGAAIVGPDSFSACTFFLNVTAASGTTPTLDVYIQKLLPDQTTWDDLVHFTQKTAAGAQVAEVVGAGSGVHTQAVRTLAAGTIQTAMLGSQHRCDVVIGGTNPSFTFTLDGEYYV